MWQKLWMEKKKEAVPDKQTKATTFKLKGSKTWPKQSTCFIKSRPCLTVGLLGSSLAATVVFTVKPVCKYRTVKTETSELQEASYAQKAPTCMKRPSDVPRLAMVRSPLMKVDIDVRSTCLNWPMNKSTRCRAVVNSVRYSSLRTSQPDEFLSRVWKKTRPQS